MVKKNNTFPENIFQPQFAVAVIGASAGGLEAIKLFLQALPQNSGIAYLFVQHLSPTHTSILPELLEKVSPIPIVTITDGVKLQPDHFYVAPENVIIKVVNDTIKLEPQSSKQKKPNAIDILFTSVGLVYESYAVGIVLSGAMNDGTLGLQTIKSYGGITFAQDEASAAFDGMPKSAAKSGVVDFVLPPAEIARHLIAINHPFQAPSLTKTEDQDIFKQILTVLRVRRGVDFQYYKANTLKRRILRRMALNKIDKPADYLYRLRESKAEQDALYNDMLISVTQFFRDPQTFDTLCKDIFPTLVRRKAGANEPLRIWIAGCATGEEAYSMGMCLQEYLGDKASTMKIQIFATDISETAITKARTGFYNQNELDGLNSSRIAQFFTRVDGQFQINKTIREMCVFAGHNMLKDPPFSRMDLISCRNVLIYLEPVLQKRALNTFHYALNDSGYLLLGKSESIGSLTDIYSTYRPADKIYLRKGPVGRFMNVTSVSKEQSFRDIDRGKSTEDIKRDIYKIADEIILNKFVPPSVLVNDKFDIIQFRGATDNWLGQPQGKPSFNILKLARNGLSFEIRNLLQQAKKSNQPARKYGLFYEYNNLQHFLNLEVVPVTDQDELYFLIVFQAASSSGLQTAMFEISRKQEDVTYDESDLRIEQLERELLQSRADMRVVSEEQEIANEELQSANEELLSSTEELQSLNEELETSREELQSTNEEIIVINNELIDRNNQLNTVRLYAESIINTIRDPLVILDKQLRVMRATKSFYKKFLVTEQDTETYYFYEISNRQWDIPELRTLLDNILPKQLEVNDFEVSNDFQYIGYRKMLVNARQLDNYDEHILLSIEDITDKKKT
ncbi:MAG: hypothetical protein EOP46_00500 [Sphingobacteriaceae bacterium]|nr:MAG: hypothetical protein EOP46_00500 [Sphingobacteriaceae bacterium]